MINCGGGLVYLLPLIFALGSYSKMRQTVRDVASISGTDLSRIERIMPPGRIARA